MILDTKCLKVADKMLVKGNLFLLISLVDPGVGSWRPVADVLIIEPETNLMVSRLHCI